MNNSGTHARFASIDALRGIAALLVVWHHSVEEFIKIPSIAAHGTLLADIVAKYDFGRIGIICFFLISGYVIPFSFQSNNPKALKNFVIRRVLRLYPAYWLSLIIIIIVNLYLSIDLDFTTILANTTMLQSFFAQPHMIGLYWTLQVELIFYVICAVLFYYKILHNNKIIFSIIMLTFLTFAITQALIVLYDVNLEISKEMQLLPYLLAIMFLGSFIRQINDSNSQIDRHLIIYTSIAIILTFGLPLFLLLTALLGYELTEGAFRFGISHCLAFGLFLLGLKALKHSPQLLLKLGLISYALYLFHPIVLKILLNILTNTSFYLPVYILITTICSIFIAALVYKIIEKPAIQLGKHWSRQSYNK